MKTRPVWTIIRYFISICSFIDPYYLYNLLGSFSIDSFLHRPILISKAVLEDVITIYILLYMDVCVLYKYTGLEYWPVTYILKNSKIIKRHVFLVWRTVQIWQLHKLYLVVWTPKFEFHLFKTFVSLIKLIKFKTCSHKIT